jgi:translation initiation factor 3 subunit C
VVRLSDEALLLELAERIQSYYLRVDDLKAASHIALLRVEHLYYKHDSMALEVRKAFLFSQKWGKYADLHPACIGKSNPTSANTSVFHPAAFQGTPTVPTPKNYHPSQEMESLCSFIFKTGDERSKTRALLCAVYYHAMHDHYHRARDLFLISHIQENIEKADTSTQILYNRALVTLGLSAFRQGLIQKAYECLFGVCSGRVRELLAQGTGARWVEKDADQENAERRRQIPYHMHINPDLLEACYLICAMLIELPHLVGRPFDRTTHHRFHFRKYLQSYNRQVFTGPPENTREHVLAAAKALLSGDWAKACQFVQSLDVWNLIPGVDAAQRVRAMLDLKLKEEALRIYLYSSVASAYSSLSLDYICAFIQMDAVTTRRIISKMIFRGEISAAWDQTSDGKTVMVLYKVDPSPMQVLALQYAEKIGALVESNERLLDPLNGSYGYKEEYQRKQYGGGTSTQETIQASNPGGRGGKGKPPPGKRDHRGHANSSTNQNRSNNRGARSAVSGAGAPAGNAPAGGGGWNNSSQTRTSGGSGGKSQQSGGGREGAGSRKSAQGGWTSSM